MAGTVVESARSIVVLTTAGLAIAAPGQLPGVDLIRTERLTMRVVIDGTGPTVLMLHGFPELAYSWRHQVRELERAGYRAVAPDMPGYGGTDAPEQVERYDRVELCLDIVALIDELGEERVHLVGHDWGAAVAWSCALQAPERFRSLIAMSVPWGARADTPPLGRIRATAGDNFFYMLYFQEPGVAETELSADPRMTLLKLFASPGTPRKPPEITSPLASAGGFLGRLGEPEELPIWLTEDGLDTYVREFARTGLAGGLSYYRNLDRSWERTADHAGRTIDIPVLFIAGEQDLVIGGRDEASLRAQMATVATDLRDVILLPGTGHWVQQERAERVTRLMLDFLSTIDPGE